MKHFTLLGELLPSDAVFRLLGEGTRLRCEADVGFKLVGDGNRLCWEDGAFRLLEAGSEFLFAVCIVNDIRLRLSLSVLTSDC